jgi:Fe-S-cluster containining protein
LFVNIKDVKNLHFSNCEGCTESCCSAPKVSLAPLILDDFEEVYKNFAIQFGYINHELKALFVINSGEGSCKYLEDNKCSIYDSRPPTCKMFPISPFYEEFYINTSCQAVNVHNGEWLCSEGEFSDSFFHKRVENFVEKLDNTKDFLFSIEDDLIPSIEVKGIQLYNYSGTIKNSYIDMHKSSILHLEGDL